MRLLMGRLQMGRFQEGFGKSSHSNGQSSRCKRDACPLSRSSERSAGSNNNGLKWLQRGGGRSGLGKLEKADDKSIYC
jgi:hypothetical protein